MVRNLSIASHLGGVIICIDACRSYPDPPSSTGRFVSISKKRRAQLGAVIVASVIVIAACGGDNSASGAGSALTVDMVEFEFRPSDAIVTAGSDVLVTLNNIGSIRHEWVVLQEGVRLEDEADKPEDEAVFQSDFVYFEFDLEPGLSETATFTAPAIPGTYQLVCAIPGHLSAGMVGVLEVTS